MIHLTEEEKKIVQLYRRPTVQETLKALQSAIEFTEEEELVESGKRVMKVIESMTDHDFAKEKFESILD